MRKTWIKRICIAVFIILIIVTGIGGNYLTEFAIARKEFNPDIMPASTVSSDTSDIILKNAEMIEAKKTAYLAKAQVETIEMNSADGLLLKADMYINDTESHRWFLGIHGYTGNRTNLQSYVPYYAEKGFNALLPDMRAHGESEGAYIGMGWPDRKDILGWIELLIEKDPEAEIIIHGVSMGGATAMMVSGEVLPDNVKTIVEDCGYTSVWDIFSDELKYLFHLPDFPILHVASMIAKIKAGYGFKEASSIEQVKKCQIPMLFIHGSEDNFVHTEMVYKVYDACPSTKEILVVEGAGHGNSYLTDPELYFDTVFRFIHEHL